MKSRVWCLSAMGGIMLLFGSGIVSAQTAAALKDKVYSDAKALDFSVPLKEAPAAELPLPLPPVRVRPAAPGGLPENCNNMPVLYVENGVLYKNGQALGSNVSSYKGACSGDAAWTDNYGTLYKNGTELGNSSRFQIAGYTGDVVWTDNYGDLCKNEEELGRAARFAVAERTGDVAWMDSYSHLYKNKAEVTSDCQSFELREDGKLIWRDNWGHYHYQ